MPKPPWRLKLRDNVFGADARVGLVNRGNVDLDISAEHLPRHRVLRERVEAGERIGRDRGADPLNDVTLVVIMRGLDQHELEAALRSRNRHECVSPLAAGVSRRLITGLLKKPVKVESRGSLRADWHGREHRRAGKGAKRRARGNATMAGTLCFARPTITSPRKPVRKACTRPNRKGRARAP